MIVIGLAGESGTGKSTLAERITRDGGVHIDGDQVAHDILAADKFVIAAVCALVGQDVLDDQGHIDRRALGKRVFADQSLLERYNAIIHPAIRKRIGDLIDQARASGKDRVVVDAALLLNSRMHYPIDMMIALRCSPDVQKQRLQAKGGWTDAEVESRLLNQRHIQKSFYKADHVIDTDGDIEDTASAIEALVRGDR